MCLKFQTRFFLIENKKIFENSHMAGSWSLFCSVPFIFVVLFFGLGQAVTLVTELRLRCHLAEIIV